jgi:hypothetical protein
MTFVKPKGLKESDIQEAIEDFLRIKGWYVLRTHGNMFQRGFPDDFACHSRYGSRWIEIKRPDRTGNPYTANQMETFPKLCANGAGVWTLVAATEDEYKKLFCPANWSVYIWGLKGT